MHVLGPDLEVEAGPASKASAGVVQVQRVGPADDLSVGGVVQLGLPLVKALQELPAAAGADTPLWCRGEAVEWV